MVAFNPQVNYEQELDELRRIYVQSPVQARYRIIRRRVEHDEIGAVRLCSRVSAVEALARSIVVQHSTQQGTLLATAYREQKHKGPAELVEAALAKLGKETAVSAFDSDTWELFQFAVEFRNLVIHECTFLGGDKYKTLIAAADEVLQHLADAAGVR